MPKLLFVTLAFVGVLFSPFSVSLSAAPLEQEIEAKEFEYPFEVKVYDLPISENGIGYRLYIRAPIGEVPEGEKAATFYFLDALTNFTSAAAMSYNYEYFNYMPAAYFIGIGYQNEADGTPKESNRTRDYTPTEFTPPEDHFLFNSKKDWVGSGGAPAFWDVVRKEIIPFVEGKYEVDSQERVLIGKSMSGLGALYPALTQPGLFKRYLIISPSIWWDDWLKDRNDRAISALAKETSKVEYPFETRIYFATGDDEERMGMVTDVYSLANMVRYQGRKNLKVAVEILDGVNHEGAYPEAFMRGIVGVYAGEEKYRLHPSSKMLEWR